MVETQKRQNSVVFGEFRLEIDSQMLYCNDEEIHLAKRPFQVLQFLIENRERVVSRDELLDKFWEGHDVYDDALRKTIGAIRKALDDLEKPPRFIETRYGSGFRFIGNVTKSENIKNGDKTGESLISNTPAENSVKREKSKPQTAPSSHYILFSIFALTIFSLVALGFFAFGELPRTNKQSLADLPKTLPEKHSIAVLPLKNLTGDSAKDYLADGITESLINELSRVNELKVTSRGSAFSLKDKEIDAREIGDKLGVETILEGGIRQIGEKIRVEVRLVSTADGRVLWTSQNFERPISNAYQLHDTIACNIARELRTELCDGTPKSGTANGDAYQNYLKGRYQWNKRTGAGIKKSIELYEQAIRLDANYAQAYAGLAESYVQGIWHVPFVPKEVLPKAEKAGLRAVELDDSLAEAHTALANVYSLNWNWSEAERELQRAIELDPRYARAYHVLAFHFVTLGRLDEAVAAIKRAKQLDPLNLVINTDEAYILFIAKRNDEAYRQWEKTLELDPNFTLAYEHRSRAFEALGNETASIEDSAKAMELNGKSAKQVAEYRRIASKNGLKEVHRKDLKELLAQAKRGENVSLITLAIFNTLLGQNDEAFQYLEKSYKNRSAEILLLPSDARFASLRSDPRYVDLLKRMRLPE